MNIQDLIRQYRGATLPKLVEKQMRSLSEHNLLQAIEGTFSNFPAQTRQQVDELTQNYLESWFGAHILTADLGDLLETTVRDVKAAGLHMGLSFDDERAFDVFNIMVMRMAHFAHSRPGFRRYLGIKKGWLS